MFIIMCLFCNVQMTVKQKERKSSMATPSPAGTAERFCCSRSLCVQESMSDVSK